jgi:hypothetical protein
MGVNVPISLHIGSSNGAISKSSMLMISPCVVCTAMFQPDSTKSVEQGLKLSGNGSYFLGRSFTDVASWMEINSLFSR